MHCARILMPYVLGLFAVNLTREFRRCCCCLERLPSASLPKTTTVLMRNTKPASHPATRSNTTYTAVSQSPSRRSEDKTCHELDELTPRKVTGHLGDKASSLLAEASPGVTVKNIIPTSERPRSVDETNTTRLIERSVTPPHIAHGRGTKENYHKYLMI